MHKTIILYNYIFSKCILYSVESKKHNYARGYGVKVRVVQVVQRLKLLQAFFKQTADHNVMHDAINYEIQLFF